jgi:hypothetical protein
MSAVSIPGATGQARLVPEWPGYAVTTTGEVWSQHFQGGRSKGTRLSAWWRKLTPDCGRQGYLRVTLMCGNGQKHMGIHQLVMLAFVGPCPPDMEVCHEDGKPTNNHLSNLRYDTQEANVADRIRHGTNACGARHGRAKLNDATVLFIRQLVSDGVAQNEVAGYFKLARTTVSSIVRRKTWTHLPD